MTPAINVAKRAKVAHRIHEYSHDPSSESYGAEAAKKLGVSEERVFKTLIVNIDGRSLVVGVIPVSSMLNMKRLAKAAGAKRAAMASPAEVERATGYVLGGVSPLGQKKRLKAYIDSSAAGCPTVFVSAGRRGLQIELSPVDLKALTHGVYVDICEPAHGVEK